jgi:peptidyl-prolyl cis-trans isomerase B (cyclophilin B)
MAIAKSKELGAPTFTPELVEAYTTLGRTPFLDGGYTVFGEVTEGLDIVEKIQNTQTSPNDRPKSDIAMEVTVMEA